MMNSAIAFLFILLSLSAIAQNTTVVGKILDNNNTPIPFLNVGLKGSDIFAVSDTGLDVSAFWTYFNNKIIADYDIDPQKIIYQNLQGHGISQGITLNSDFNFTSGLKVVMGATLMDVFTKTIDNQKELQVQTPRFTANWSVSYTTLKNNWTFDLTGTTTSPMRLPVQTNDFRPDHSPWFSIVNFQVRKPLNTLFEVYFGRKNLLDFKPQFPLMRPFDPFDKSVGINNPFGYTFDTTYNYAPLQGFKLFLGVRYTIK